MGTQAFEEHFRWNRLITDMITHRIFREQALWAKTWNWLHAFPNQQCHHQHPCHHTCHVHIIRTRLPYWRMIAVMIILIWSSDFFAFYLINELLCSSSRWGTPAYPGFRCHHCQTARSLPMPKKTPNFHWRCLRIRNYHCRCLRMHKIIIADA